jgi:hypothetical protein
MKKIFLIMSMFMFSMTAIAQVESKYDHKVLFHPLENFQYNSLYRSGSGRPGPEYWQNSADYKIKVDFDDQTRKIQGNVEIIYKNNSPEDLPFLWLQLDQNSFSLDSRGTKTTPITGGRFGNLTFDGGYEISNVMIDGKPANYIIEDTRMQIRLTEPLAKKKGKTTISMNFSFISPEDGSDRMGIQETENGEIFTIAQWYPRVCVYDDIEGWNTLPYLGAGEFYLEYGNYEYSITAPASQIIVGSGELMNPQDVYTKTQLDRWNKAKNSEETIIIRSENEVNDPSSRPNKDKLTWKFKIENARDVAWASSKAFIIDAANINLPSGKKSLAISAYPKESIGKDGWERSTEFIKASVEYYSSWLYEFTYPAATNVAGTVSGMEYPGIIFCGYKDKGESLFGVTDHEFGHNWFPMIVGSNERKFPWMDEGFNTFINIHSANAFNKGEYKNRYTMDMLKNYLFNEKLEPIMTIPDVQQARNLGILAYMKPGFGLELLREVILGPDRFDYAFKQYIKDWAFKHPTPFDFFKAMEDGSGEDLNWFWREWFFETWTLDQMVEKVQYINQKPEEGAVITIRNLDRMALPTEVRVSWMDGTDKTYSFPVEIWQRGDTWEFKTEGKGLIKSVVIDPDKKLPDLNPKNNTWLPFSIGK